jgi:AcrR family transcriptional regulator
MEEEARRLPPGAHGIPPDVVARNQRERLVAAVAEACFESGYAEISIRDLTQAAGISSATFYGLFTSKLECALAAHRDLLERLLEVDRACAEEGEREAKLRVGVRTVLSLFAADPPTARLLTVEVMALGPAGNERNEAAVGAFAQRLQAARKQGGERSPGADWILLAGISMLIGKQVMAGEAAELPQLEDELVATIADPR